MADTELLRCPFCGGACDPEGWVGSGIGGASVRGPECEECGACTDTVEDWNRRATPPSPSTAPEGCAWLPLEPAEAMVHAAEDLPAPRMFGKVWRAMAGAALASRPTEVDDEGLPELPEPFENWDPRYEGLILPVFTAEQYRQGQRDAVAADRARRGVKP